MSNTYIALTIGPIFKVIEASRRTRMTWAGSYFFSYLIRELVFTHLKPALGAGNENKIIVPAHEVKDPAITNGAGIYPDRLIIRADVGDFERVQGAIDSLLKQVAADVHRHINNTRWAFDKRRQTSVSQIEKYLHEFLKLYFIEMAIPNSLQGETGDAKEKVNILGQLYKRLEVLELRQKNITDASLDFLMHFLFRVNKRSATGEHSMLVEDAFGKGKKRFDSLMEISTRGLGRLSDYQPNVTSTGVLDDMGFSGTGGNFSTAYDHFVSAMITSFQEAEDENIRVPNALSDLAEEDNEVMQDSFLEALQRYYGKHFQNYHKYVAVIYADGDNIGGLLKEIGGRPEALRAFSSKLIEFNVQASKIVVDFGAAPIYLGSEDILLFSPVACLDQPAANGRQQLRTVFDLVKELDALFEGLFVDEIATYEDGKKPTLSWGIAIGYYKHPLMDTIKAAHDQLMIAKNKKGNPDKNSIGLRIQKHSGQFFEALIEKKHSSSYGLFQNMLNDLVRAPSDKDAAEKTKLISGITHRLKNELFATMLEEAVQQSTVEYFLANNFNEVFHKNPNSKAYLDDLKNFIMHAYKEYGATESAANAKKAKDFVYAALRFIHFVDSKNEEE